MACAATPLSRSVLTNRRRQSRSVARQCSAASRRRPFTLPIGVRADAARPYVRFMGRFAAERTQGRAAIELSRRWLAEIAGMWPKTTLILRMTLVAELAKHLSWVRTLLRKLWYVKVIDRYAAAASSPYTLRRRPKTCQEAPRPGGENRASLGFIRRAFLSRIAQCVEEPQDTRRYKLP